MRSPASRRGLGLWLAGLLLCACSSNAKPGTKPGSTGGAPGNGGAPGSGGSGGVRAVDAATDRSPSDAAHDTGASTPDDQACRAAFQAQCQILAGCGYNTLEGCLAEAVLCPDYYFSVASGLTVQGVTDCLADIAKITCTDWDLQLRPTCLAGGTRPPGAACVHGTDCQSGACSGRNKACGTCSDLAPATGESCATSSCRPGDFCHPQTQLCTSGSTIVYAGMGESCDLSASPVVGCTGDLHCIAPTAGTTAGICRPALGNGESCAGTGAICGPSLECYDLTICQPIPPDPSPTCGDAGVCDDATFCSGYGRNMTCLPRAGIGQVCSVDGGPVTTECVSPAVCLGGPPWLCTVYGNLGDACNDTTQPCGGSYLVCMNGHCGTFQTSSCPDVPADAGP